MKRPDDLNFLDPLLRMFAYEPSGWGVVRIAGWFAAFLVLSAVMAPPRTTELPDHGERMVTMHTFRNDPRWVRQDLARYPVEPASPSIAWITGSSAFIYGPGLTGTERLETRELLPERVAERLERDHGVTPRVYLHQLDARRLLDTATMTTDAIRRQPDAMVIVLNPFWSFNDQAIFHRTELMRQGAVLWWNRHDWTRQFLLVPPRTHLEHLVGRCLPLVGDRHDYGDLIDFQGWARNMWSRTAPRPQTGPSLIFWVTHRDHDGDISTLREPNGALDILAWQATAMAQANPDPSAWPAKILDDLMEQVADSGIPTLVYVAPVSPELRKHPEAAAALDAANAGFTRLAERHQGEGIRFVTSFPPSVLDSLSFEDLLHLDNAGELPAFIEQELSDILRLP